MKTEKIIASELVSNGLFKIKINDFAGALGCFVKAIELDPQNPEAHRNKGFTEIKLAEDPFEFNDVYGYTIAINDFEKAIQINPNDYEFLFGHALAMYLGYHAEDDASQGSLYLKSDIEGIDGYDFIKVGGVFETVQMRAGVSGGSAAFIGIIGSGNIWLLNNSLSAFLNTGVSVISNHWIIHRKMG